MGVDGIPGVPTCMRDFGDDGLLRSVGHGAGCNAMYNPILNYQPGMGVTPDAFATDVACVALLGTGGCGFEHQLESPLKAITPTTAQSWTSANFVPIGTPGAPRGLERPFWRNSAPHGDRENAGFVRDNSVLAVVVVSDEDDCSAFDPSLYNPSSTTYSGPLNVRCHQYGDAAVHPVDRYVNGFIQLRSRANLLVYAAITGLPTDLSPACTNGSCAAPNWDALVGDPSVRDPRMIEQVTADAQNIQPTCQTNNPDGSIRTSAAPGIRIVSVAHGLQQLGAGVSVHSICDEDFGNALLDVINQIKSALSAACLPRALNVEADGSVNCDVVTVMPEGMGCDAIMAMPKRDQSMNPVMEGNRAVCVVHQLVPTSDNRGAMAAPDGTGWYYDNYTGEGSDNCLKDGATAFQRIAFTGTQPPSGAEVRLECFLAVQGSGSNTDIGLGTFCDPTSTDQTANPCPSGMTPSGNGALACDQVSRVCGVECQSDADCRSAGLIGYVCDPRLLSAIDSTQFMGMDTPHNYCVNPTCG